jgi:hypothetical protein
MVFPQARGDIATRANNFEDSRYWSMRAWGFGGRHNVPHLRVALVRQDWLHGDLRAAHPQVVADE